MINTNLLAIDTEDWYHPEYVRKKVAVKYDKIQDNIYIILNLLKKYNVKCTFFVVGEIAINHPEVVSKIIDDKHEIGYHGHDHKPLWDLNPEQFDKEIKLFTDLCIKNFNYRPVGYRAPSYSLDNTTLWVLRSLCKNNYLYDASVFPMKSPLYGIDDVPFFPYHPSFDDLCRTSNSDFIEFPSLIYKKWGITLPFSGGFYLRIFPISFFKKAINNCNQLGYPATISIHTWELDADTPRINIGIKDNFITYFNIQNTYKKFENLLINYKFMGFKQFIEENKI